MAVKRFFHAYMYRMEHKDIRLLVVLSLFVGLVDKIVYKYLHFFLCLKLYSWHLERENVGISYQLVAIVHLLIAIAGTWPLLLSYLRGCPQDSYKSTVLHFLQYNSF
jgi:hypothetical protein